MGQAKRRKELGLMPELSQKPRKRARRKVDPMDDMYGMDSMAMILGTLMMGSHLRSNLLMRNDMARMNQELDRPSGHQST